MFRIISSAVKCFDDVKVNIRQRCRHEGAQIYHVHYIQPLVERTRDTVLTRCSLSSPYSAYFTEASSLSTSVVSRPLFIVLLLSSSQLYLYHLSLHRFASYWICNTCRCPTGQLAV